MGDDLIASGSETVEEEKEGLGSAGRFAVDLGVGATQLAGDVGIGFLTGGGALLPLGLRAFGGAIMYPRNKTRFKKRK